MLIKALKIAKIKAFDFVDFFVDLRYVILVDLNAYFDVLTVILVDFDHFFVIFVDKIVILIDLNAYFAIYSVFVQSLINTFKLTILPI